MKQDAITNAQRIGKLIFRYMRNELTSSQRTELDAWRKLSPGNEQTFQDAINPDKLWADLKSIQDSRERRNNKMRRRLNEKRKSLLGKTSMQKPVIEKKPRSIARRIGMAISKIAAVLVLVFCSLVVIYTYKYKTAESRSAEPDADQLSAVISLPDLDRNSHFNMGFLSGMANLTVKEGENGWFIAKVDNGKMLSRKKYYRLFTAKDSRFLLNFADGTSIALNSNATIKYPTWLLQDSIHIYINGEAYINIPDTTKHHYFFKISPPINNVGPSAFRQAVADKNSRSIQFESDSGAFHVMAYADGPATTVTLVNGNVRIDSVGGKVVAPIMLEHGQQAKLDSGSLNILRLMSLDSMWRWKSLDR